MGILIVLILVSAVFLTVIVAQQQQTIKQEAYSGCAGCAPGCCEFDYETGESFCDTWAIGCRGDEPPGYTCEQGECGIWPVCGPCTPTNTCENICPVGVSGCIEYYCSNDSCLTDYTSQNGASCWGGSGRCENGNCVEIAQPPAPPPTTGCDVSCLPGCCVSDYETGEQFCNDWSNDCKPGGTGYVNPTPPSTTGCDASCLPGCCEYDDPVYGGSGGYYCDTWAINCRPGGTGYTCEQDKKCGDWPICGPCNGCNFNGIDCNSAAPECQWGYCDSYSGQCVYYNANWETCSNGTCNNGQCVADQPAQPPQPTQSPITATGCDASCLPGCCEYDDPVYGGSGGYYCDTWAINCRPGGTGYTCEQDKKCGDWPICGPCNSCIYNGTDCDANAPECQTGYCNNSTGQCTYYNNNYKTCPGGTCQDGACSVNLASDNKNSPTPTQTSLTDKCGWFGYCQPDDKECTEDRCKNNICEHPARTGASCNGGSGRCQSDGSCKSDSTVAGCLINCSEYAAECKIGHCNTNKECEYKNSAADTSCKSNGGLPGICDGFGNCKEIEIVTMGPSEKSVTVLVDAAKNVSKIISDLFGGKKEETETTTPKVSLIALTKTNENPLTPEKANTGVCAFGLPIGCPTENVCQKATCNSAFGGSDACGTAPANPDVVCTTITGTSGYCIAGSCNPGSPGSNQSPPNPAIRKPEVNPETERKYAGETVETKLKPCGLFNVCIGDGSGCADYHCNTQTGLCEREPTLTRTGEPCSTFLTFTDSTNTCQNGTCQPKINSENDPSNKTALPNSAGDCGLFSLCLGTGSDCADYHCDTATNQCKPTAINENGDCGNNAGICQKGVCNPKAWTPSKDRTPCLIPYISIALCPSDGNPCHVKACQGSGYNSICGFNPANPGTACELNGAKGVCSSDGQCDTKFPSTAKPTTTNTCNGGTCVKAEECQTTNVIKDPKSSCNSDTPICCKSPSAAKITTVTEDTCTPATNTIKGVTYSCKSACASGESEAPKANACPDKNDKKQACCITKTLADTCTNTKTGQKCKTSCASTETKGEGTCPDPKLPACCAPKPPVPTSRPCPSTAPIPPAPSPGRETPTPTPVLVGDVTLVSALNAKDVVLTANNLSTNLMLYSLATNTQVTGAPSTQVYNSTAIPGRQYSAEITLTGLYKEKYFIVIRYNNMIAKSVFTVSASARTITVPTTTLVFGDVNNDNDIDITDYNMFRNCWKQSAVGACTASDFDQTGEAINEVDYNTWVRGLATWKTEATSL